MRLCKIIGCVGKHKGHGWCDKHYQRWKSHGNPLYPTFHRESLSVRFWAKVKKRDIDHCWLWTGAADGHGYGVIATGGGSPMISTHRLSWKLANGKIPHGMCICHKCDVRLCCNPAHLWLGTNADNTADKMAKGRHRPVQGEAHGCAKLTEKQVLAIRDAKGLLRKIGKRFGISESVVSNIKHRKTWAHVP